MVSDSGRRRPATGADPDTAGRMDRDLAIDAPRPDVHVIRAGSDLDAATAARLLRLVDARVRLVAMGYSPTRHILIDVGATHTVSPTALDLLGSAATDRHGVGMHLIGIDALMAGEPVEARRHLVRFSAFPSVPAALAALR